MTPSGPIDTKTETSTYTVTYLSNEGQCCSRPFREQGLERGALTPRVRGGKERI